MIGFLAAHAKSAMIFTNVVAEAALAVKAADLKAFKSGYAEPAVAGHGAGAWLKKP
jgi:hypothetical protein